MEFTGKINILLVEDNAGDVRLIKEAFKDSRIENKFSVVYDGEKAMDYLYKRGEYADTPRPDIIFLDLNLPKKSGLEILAEIKSHPELRKIPVVILTTSSAAEHIQKSYGLYANCYVTKPVDYNQFADVVKVIEGFWFNVARLPKAAIQ
jgi:chemotaxis family two-component system response regulator Rcp1